MNTTGKCEWISFYKHIYQDRTKVAAHEFPGSEKRSSLVEYEGKSLAEW